MFLKKLLEIVSFCLVVGFKKVGSKLRPFKSGACRFSPWICEGHYLSEWYITIMYGYLRFTKQIESQLFDGKIFCFDVPIE